MDEFCEVFQTCNKGRGLRTIKTIQKGCKVCDYQGELINKSTAVKREQEYGSDKECYMFYFQRGSKTLCIDATKTEHFSRYINHSKKFPNLKPVRKRRTNIIEFISLREIKAGEELFFDYGDQRREIVEANPWLLE